MKTIKIFLLVFVFLLIAVVLFREWPVFTTKSRNNNGKVLMTTRWQGSGPYAKMAPGPDTNTLGCWSTAFSQIFYYHKLAPNGTVQYLCSKGYEIKKEWQSERIDWTLFGDAINDSTAVESINEISRFCYANATVVQKDFGTGRYKTKLPSPKKLGSYYDAKFKMIFNYNGWLKSNNSFKNIVVREIEAKRPIFFYYKNMDVSGTGHAVVIDGYKIEKNTFLVHLNFGWGGEKDGWFNMFEDIATSGDSQLRFLVTVKPSSIKVFKVKSPLTKVSGP
jgi:hypothetical protein